MQIDRIRAKFPFFAKTSSIYLDSAATAQKPQIVLDALEAYYTGYNANIARGVHRYAEKATERYESVRQQVADWIGASSPDEVIFTPGTTSSINMVAQCWARQHISKGDEIVLLESEHHSNFLPWQRIAKESGAKLSFIPLDLENYVVLPSRQWLEQVITPKTKLVTVAMSSNVLGPIWAEGQLSALIVRAHEVGARVLLDAAQDIVHHKVNVAELGVDFFAFSGHKIGAPTGIGVLYAKKDLNSQLEPYELGGSMVYEAHLGGARWQKMPHMLEAGTPPIAQVIGLGAAIEFYNDHIDYDELTAHQAKLCTKIIDGFEKIGGISVIGNVGRLKKRGHLVTFTVDGVHSHDVAAYLDTHNIAIRAGHHCAQPLADKLGVQSTARVSLFCYNTTSDIDAFLSAMQKLREQVPC